MRTILTLLIGLAFGFVAMVFGGSNDQPVTVNFLLFKHETNLSHLIALSFAIGLVVGLLLVSFKVIRQWVVARINQSKVDKLQNQVSSLRAEPARDKY